MRKNPSSAYASSAKSRQGYANRRAVSRVFAPTAATGGFPYNAKPVADADPLPSRRANCTCKPQEYGYRG